MSESPSATVELRCAFCLEPNTLDVARAAERPKCSACGRPFLLDRPVKVNEEDFDRTVLGAGVPILVDFYADWCGPCKMVAPILDNVAHEHAGRLLVAKIDTDRAPGLSARFEIRSIPTLILFRDGEESERSVGLEPARLRGLVEDAIRKP